MDDTYRSQFRMPYALYELLKKAADESKRSVNAELVARLSASFSAEPMEKNGAPLVRVILDSRGYPLSWDEIDEHLRAIKHSIEKTTVAYETTIITPDLVSNSDREDEAQKLRQGYTTSAGVFVPPVEITNPVIDLDRRTNHKKKAK